MPDTDALLLYPGPWAFQLPHAGIILVSDEELVQLAGDPDRVLNLATGFEPRERSLRQVCEEAQARGAGTLMLAFDHFFAQYRPGINHARALTPDDPAYVEHIARIGRFAAGYGLKLELSLLSPLEIGPAYARETGECGRWLQYRKGLRDPQTGAFSVQLWQHRRWVNNKGPVELEPLNVRVFAFREEPVPGTSCRVVRPAEIVEISDVAQVEVFEGMVAGEERGEAPEWVSGALPPRRIRIFGRGRTDVGRLNRVLVVQQYRVPEMDYFSDSALPYLKRLLDRYFDAGVELSGFYSDEMHIQQDWDYFRHHEHGQFALRYVSAGLERRFAEAYGAEYADLAKYLVYFACGQEDFAADLSATEHVQHVFGPSPEEIHATALFRSRYYTLLQDGVVNLFLAARHYAEGRAGRRLYTRAHATWAESPTIDYWRTGARNMNSRKYEYGSHFVWSNTVHQAASACHDYFKWGEFLTGTGNDHAECGWLDRNYYGLALACSTGIVNEVPYSYAAHWGSPAPVAWRRHQLEAAFGVSGGVTPYTLVQEMQHRDIEVLMLYPLDLVAAEERFGSWMTQYAYANLITQAKLLEMGTVRRGAVELAGRRFTTLAATFEPFPDPRLLEMMEALAQSGGRAIWSGPPPLLDRAGRPIRERWEELFGVTCAPSPDGWGQMAPGRTITFEGALKDVAPQVVLTDFLVDHLYPVTCRPGTEVTARSGKAVVGTYRPIQEGGILAYLGYRPRDDQAASMGVETRNWFEVLCAYSAYLAGDNPTVISRMTGVLACRFPNGATTIAPHLCRLEECWPGGFARNAEEDEAALRGVELPSDRLSLIGFRVNGHDVEYEGRGAVAFRTDAAGRLVAFAGQGCSEITVDGRRWAFAERPVGCVGWAPVSEERRVPGGAEVILFRSDPGPLRLPAGTCPAAPVFFAEGAAPGSKGERLAGRQEGDAVVVEVTETAAGRWVYGVSG